MNAAAAALALKHARPEHLEPACEIRVIAGGLLGERDVPRHARAELVEQPLAKRQAPNMRGVSFDLSAGERAFAVGAGAFFALASLAAVML